MGSRCALNAHSKERIIRKEMPCYKPKIRVEYQNVYKTAKDGHQYKKGVVMSADDYEKFNKINNELVKIQRIPCGNCIGCRLDYSKQWATRCMLEAKNSENNWFLTLTYDNENIPMKSEIMNKETGEIFYNDGSWTGTLQPEDMTKFIKRLRKHWKYHYNVDEIRYFYCGEYGGQTGRPHYHMIVFGLPIEKDDLIFKFANENYQPIYECPKIAKIWGKGIVSVGKVTFSSCAYVARYVTKKIKGYESEEQYAKQGRIPEYVQMSRNPGIGLKYYLENKKEIYHTDTLYQTTCKGNIVKLNAPRYYDKKLKEEDPELMEMIKENRRRKAEAAEKMKMNQTTAKIKDQYHYEEGAKVLKVAGLERKL